MKQNNDKLTELLRATDCVPDAPDCRRVVMDRIASPGPRFRLAWAYTVAVVVLIGLALGWVIYFAPSQPAGKPIVKTAPPAPKRTATERPMASSVGAKAFRRIAVPRPTPPTPEPNRVARSEPKRTFRHVRRAPQLAKHTPVKEPTPTAPEPAARYDENAPVALVVVSGPTSEPSGGYGYTQTDTETGQVTNCSVTRTGNEVHIYLESTPGKDAPPVKGSLDYEIPNA